MSKDRDINDGDQIVSGTLGDVIEGSKPVLFFCRHGLCLPKMVVAKGRTLVEARGNIAEEDVPSCPHGIMHSSRRSRPN